MTTNRFAAPTPPFFKKVRNTGLALAAISASVLAAPVALPALLLKIAGYLAVAGTVASTVSQATVAAPPGEIQPPGAAKKKKAAKPAKKLVKTEPNGTSV